MSSLSLITNNPSLLPSSAAGTNNPSALISSATAPLIQHQQQQHALQQFMVTQNMFNSLSPEQRLIAQQLAAETIQLSLLQDFPKNIQVIKTIAVNWFDSKTKLISFFLRISYTYWLFSINNSNYNYKIIRILNLYCPSYRIIIQQIY